MPQNITIDNKEIPVEQFRNDWALALMSQGVIVRLSVSRWRANAKLTPEVLGLKFTDEASFNFSRKYLELGRQKLLPPEVLAEIVTLENRARTNLENYSFDTVWGSFVPFTAYDEWERNNKIIHDDFMQAAVILGNKYDEIINSVKEEYKKMAKDVWIRLYPEDKGGVTSSFIEDFVDKIIVKIPPREDIVSSFRYDATFFIIPMPSFVADNIAKAEQIKRQEEMAQLESDLEKTTKRRISEEYIKRKKELIDGFLESTVLGMRKYVSELCDDVLLSINKKGRSRITSRHINKLKEMIKKVKLLNFYNDKEMSDMVKGLDLELDRIKGELNQDVVVGKLREIVDASKREYLPKNFNPSIGILDVNED